MRTKRKAKKANGFTVDVCFVESDFRRHTAATKEDAEAFARKVMAEGYCEFGRPNEMTIYPPAQIRRIIIEKVG